MISIVDTNILSSYVGPDNDVSLISYLLTYFKQNVPDKIKSAQFSFDGRDFTKCAYHLHSLKNSLLNMGALQSAKDCQDLEDNIKNLDAMEFSMRIQRIERCVSEISFAVETFLSQVQASPSLALNSAQSL